MNKLGELLTKHRNIFLSGLLTSTLIVSWYANRQQATATSATVCIPVTETVASPLSPLESCRQQRDQEALRDMAALEALVNQPLLDESTREAAADRLQMIVDARQTQSALESAMSASSLAPCVAVVSGGNVTIVTEKDAVTDKDSALVLTLAEAHAGAKPENVRIITAD